jgi:hypothetical protein
VGKLRRAPLLHTTALPIELSHCCRTQATSRIRRNIAYYKINYGIFTVATTALVLLMNPWSLMVLAGLAAVWFYMYIIKTTPLVLGNRELSEREKFLLLSGISLVVIFFVTQ